MTTQFEIDDARNLDHAIELAIKRATEIAGTPSAVLFLGVKVLIRSWYGRSDVIIYSFELER